MLQTIEGIIDVDGQIRWLEPLRVAKPSRVLVTLLPDTNGSRVEPEEEREKEVDEAVAAAHSQTPPLRNEAMFAALQRSAERLKDVPVSGSTEETLLMIRRARGGEMWGYKPTDYE